MDKEIGYDPFEGRRGKSFFSQKDIEEFERYWHLKYDAFKADIHDNECLKPHNRLWQIKYVVEGEQKFIGCATIMAPTPKQAEVIFLNESNFNGFRDYLRLTEIQEIMLPLSPAMLAESYTGVIDKGWLQKYPFETKKHAHSMYHKIFEILEQLKTKVEDNEQRKENE